MARKPRSTWQCLSACRKRSKVCPRVTSRRLGNRAKQSRRSIRRASPAWQGATESRIEEPVRGLATARRRSRRLPASDRRNIPACAGTDQLVAVLPRHAKIADEDLRLKLLDRLKGGLHSIALLDACSAGGEKTREDSPCVFVVVDQKHPDAVQPRRQFRRDWNSRIGGLFARLGARAFLQCSVAKGATARQTANLCPALCFPPRTFPPCISII